MIVFMYFCREKPESNSALEGVVVDKPKFGTSTKSTGTSEQKIINLVCSFLLSWDHVLNYPLHFSLLAYVLIQQFINAIQQAPNTRRLNRLGAKKTHHWQVQQTQRTFLSWQARIEWSLKHWSLSKKLGKDLSKQFSGGDGGQTVLQ